MLIIDGVKYEAWIPPNEDEFEQVVKEHAQDIFGEQSIYLDIKTRLKSKLGTGSVPDGFVIFFGNAPRWRIVEVELSSHPLHDHIVAQVGRFISGIENLNTQKKIVDTVYSEVVKSDLDALKLKKAIQPIETYKFLSDLISKPPILTIIIEKATPELREVLRILRYPQEIKVVEFQTYTREGVGLPVHAHLFKPQYQAPPKKVTITEVTEEGSTIIQTGETRRKVVVSPTGEKLSRTKFVERFASESERKASVTNERYPYVMVDTQAKFEAFLAKHPECAGWTLRDNT